MKAKKIAQKAERLSFPSSLTSSKEDLHIEHGLCKIGDIKRKLLERVQSLENWEREMEEHPDEFD